MPLGGYVSTPLTMALSPEEVKKIAQLARLDLSPAEVAKYAAQLSAILDHIEVLKKLDVAKIEPTAHAVSVPTPFRKDEVIPFSGQESVLAAAPDRDGKFFRVPKVL